MNVLRLKTKIVKYIAGMALALSVTACASTQSVSRNDMIQSPPQSFERIQPKVVKSTFGNNAAVLVGNKNARITYICSPAGFGKKSTCYTL